MAFELFPGHGQENSLASAEAGEPSQDAINRLPARSAEEVGEAHIGLAAAVRAESVAALNHILADTMTLRDLYKKHHWQTYGSTFYPLHQLFDKHHEQQVALIDEIAERIQTLGGAAIAMAADVAVTTRVTLPPVAREEPLRQLARLIDAHERTLTLVRRAAWRAAELGDDGTNDLLVGEVIRTNEKQAWFVLQQSQPCST
jgi:starvation-inducible DNA-binding protein